MNWNEQTERTLCHVLYWDRVSGRAQNHPPSPHCPLAAGRRQPGGLEQGLRGPEAHETSEMLVGRGRALARTSAPSKGERSEDRYFWGDLNLWTLALAGVAQLAGVPSCTPKGVPPSLPPFL